MTRILNQADLDRLESYTHAAMDDQQTADNVRRFAWEALPNLLATVRYWTNVSEQLMGALDSAHDRTGSPLSVHTKPAYISARSSSSDYPA